MQWYLIHPERLEAEVSLMKDNGVNFSLWQDDDGEYYEKGALFWRGALSVLGHYHGDIRLVYPKKYPDKPMTVYVLEPKLPVVNNHIHGDGRICYIRPDEWYSDWNAYWVYLTTIRFLNDFYSGRMDGSPLSYTSRSRGVLDRIWEALGL